MVPFDCDGLMSDHDISDLGYTVLITLTITSHIMSVIVVACFINLYKLTNVNFSSLMHMEVFLQTISRSQTTM